MEIRFGLHWSLGLGQAKAVEPDLFRLLHYMDERGSLQVAAKNQGVSYRYAWGLMQKWKRALGQPLARLERGRGAVLTPLGEKLLWAERRINARLGPELESLGSELAADLRAVLQVDSGPPLRIYASHGLAIPLLRDLLQTRRGIRVDLQFRGSLDSVRLLRGSKCDLAGFHLPDGALGVRLAPRFRRSLDPDSDVLIHAVRRRQGIMAVQDNPKRIESVADLAKNSLSFVNRQPGSGTRMILDLLLEGAGIVPETIHGYSTEEFTHMAVAAIIASGGADAGFGIEAAARHFGLHFIPVTWENYWFALPRDTLSKSAVSELVSMLRSVEFKSQADALPGYDAAQAGTIVPVNSIIAYSDAPAF